MQLNNKQSLTIVRFLLFTMGLILSGHALAEKTIYATGEDLDTEISNRVDGDTAEATARDAAIDTAVEAVLPPLPPVSSSGASVLGYCAETDSLVWSTGAIYEIGDTGPAGGIVFNVTNCGLKGLEAAPAGWHGNTDPSAAWGCRGTDTGASETAIGTGAQNTADILEDCLESRIAAEKADDYKLNGYTDWFLPSKDELNKLFKQKNVVGGFAKVYYWSSSEGSSDGAWAQYFYLGHQHHFSKYSTRRVRAVRAF